jgi:ubiquinone/menaquinone biosynthesis C-methylase UbiE
MVRAIDVSKGMIACARKHLAGANIEFHITNGLEVPLRDGSAGAVFSTDVFQHFESLGDARVYFRDIVRVMAPGASLMIHLPVHNWPTGNRRPYHRLHRFLRRFANLKAKRDRWLMTRGRRAPIMRTLSYEQPWLFGTFHEVGLESVQLKTFLLSKDEARKAPYTFVFARKPRKA